MNASETVGQAIKVDDTVGQTLKRSRREHVAHTRNSSPSDAFFRWHCLDVCIAPRTTGTLTFYKYSIHSTAVGLWLAWMVPGLSLLIFFPAHHDPCTARKAVSPHHIQGAHRLVLAWEGLSIVHTSRKGLVLFHQYEKAFKHGSGFLWRDILSLVHSQLYSVYGFAYNI